MTTFLIREQKGGRSRGKTPGRMVCPADPDAVKHGRVCVCVCVSRPLSFSRRNLNLDLYFLPAQGFWRWSGCSKVPCKATSQPRSTYVVQWYSVAGGFASALHVSFTSIRCRYQLPSNPSMVTSGSSVRQGVMFVKGEVRRAGLGARWGGGKPQRVMSLRRGKDKEKARRRGKSDRGWEVTDPQSRSSRGTRQRGEDGQSEKTGQERTGRQSAPRKGGGRKRGKRKEA